MFITVFFTIVKNQKLNIQTEGGPHRNLWAYCAAVNKGRKADEGGRAVCEVYNYMETTCHAHMGWSQLNENYEHLKDR